MGDPIAARVRSNRESNRPSAGGDSALCCDSNKLDDSIAESIASMATRGFALVAVMWRIVAGPQCSTLRLDRAFSQTLHGAERSSVM